MSSTWAVSRGSRGTSIVHTGRSANAARTACIASGDVSRAKIGAASSLNLGSLKMAAAL
jgi:hypothetical protein